MHKILIIDDEPAIVRVLSMSLKADGYTVFGAHSGEEGLDVFAKERPDIVLTDIRMPGIDGLEVLHRIKAQSEDTEVIIITGHGDIDSAIDALQFGASDFINKPVRDESLAIALKRAIEKITIRRRLASYTHDLEDMVEEATQEIRRQAAFQSNLIRSSNDAIVATDEKWRIVIYNPAAKRIFGYTRDEVLEHDVHEIFPETVFPRLMAAAEQTADTINPKEAVNSWQEDTLTTKDGAVVPVRHYGRILLSKGEMVGSVTFFHDLTEVKRLEQELVQAERLAAIGQTVAGMAHCIKNILHGFKGGSYIMDIGIDKNDTDKLTKGWQMIQRNIRRTSDLVLDLLSYSKSRAPEYEPCRPNEIAADVVDLLQQVAEEHGVTLARSFSEDVKEVVLDPRTVHRGLMNLVSNAIDACAYDDTIDKDHRVDVKTSLDPDGRIRFDVTDNGSGMSDEVREKLFGSFFSTKGAKGTGLGLLVTAKLIQEHGGAIRVESAENVGAAFTVWLPPQKLKTEAADHG